MSPRKRQMDLRYRRRVEVHYGEAGQPALIGFSGNISSTGMMIRTPRVMPPGTVLDIELRFPEGAVQVTGQVIWARTGPMQWLSTGRLGMGIRFHEPPTELIETLRIKAAAR